MSENTRWTINELRARYELEPTIRDVFVEGKFDQEILSSCLRNAKQHDRIVYEIDNIEVPNDLVFNHGLTLGNKQRVIILARELALLPADCEYRCIVDRDLDHWFGILETTPRLIWLKYCSIELYFFSEDILKDLLINMAKSKISNWHEYFNSLINVLSDLYALHLTDHELNWSLKWLSVDKSLIRSRNSIDFDLLDFVKRLLLKNGKSKYQEQFTKHFSKWRKKLHGDHRCYMRGHDFVSLLSWTIANFNGVKDMSSAVIIERIFVLLASRAVNIEELFV